MRDMESVLRQKKFLTLTKEITEPNRNKYLAIKKKRIFKQSHNIVKRKLVGHVSVNIDVGCTWKLQENWATT